MLSRHAFLSALLCAGTTSVAAQQEPPTTLHIETRLATADVTVLDKRTKAPVENLTATDFRVFDNDKPQPITRFSLVGKDDRPLAVVLLLEVLGYNTDVNAKLPEAARRAFAHLRPDDRIAIVYWGVTTSACQHEVALAQPFTADVTQLAATLQRLSDVTPVSRDACHKVRSHQTKEERQKDLDEIFKKQDEAIRLASVTLDLLPDSRKELIAIDQDLSITSRKSADKEADELLTDGLSLNAIIKPSFMNSMLKGIVKSADGEVYQTALLAYYADQTGGTVVSPKREDTDKGLEDLLFGIRAEYSLGWKPPEGDGFHKIRIELVHPGPLVHSKSGYYTGPPPPPSTPSVPPAPSPAAPAAGVPPSSL